MTDVEIKLKCLELGIASQVGDPLLNAEEYYNYVLYFEAGYGTKQLGLDRDRLKREHQERAADFVTSFNLEIPCNLDQRLVHESLKLNVSKNEFICAAIDHYINYVKKNWL